jgi:hypothetical protein
MALWLIGNEEDMIVESTDEIECGYAGALVRAHVALGARPRRSLYRY